MFRRDTRDKDSELTSNLTMEKVNLPVPTLRLTKVKVIYAVEIHIFCVPCKTTFPHPKIQIGCIDSVNAYTIISIDVIQNRSQLVDIPFGKKN